MKLNLQSVLIGLNVVTLAIVLYYFLPSSKPASPARVEATGKPASGDGAVVAQPGEAVPIVPGQPVRLNTQGSQQSVAPTNTQQMPATQGSVPADPSTFTKVTFAETSFNFGVIKEGDKVSHTYKFKNTGDKPLSITNCQASCGCTTPNWPREPIAPGASGEITAVFNSAHKVGPQDKYINVTANVAEPIRLQIKGEVIENPNAPKKDPHLGGGKNH